ncbi:MAG: hypothetical protein HKN46_00125 [Acidimicrobiia bacterium]|nr:hypothetical protein [Acidimicrobiia bacterium]
MAVMPHEGTHTIIFGTIAVPVGSAQFDGYLARPDQSDPARSVVVLHGADGLTPDTKDLCRVLARQGWVVLAPDWFRGAEPSVDALASISDHRAIALIDEVVEFLASDDLPYADATRPAVVGVGAGGRFGLLYADHNRSVSAVVAVEPMLGDDVAEAVSGIGAPVLGFFGADDEAIEVESVDALQAGTPNGQWIVYEGVGAGFLDAGGDGYHAGAERDALARTVRVLAAALA